MTNLLRIRQKLIELDQHRGIRQIAVSRFVYAIDEITGLLEFNREEVSCGDVDTLHFYALMIAATGGDLVRPEFPAALIGIAVEEVQILLTNEELGVVDGVTGLRRGQ